MSTEKRLGGEGAAPKGKFLRHLDFGYAKNISFKPVPSDEALDDMLRMNMSKDVIDGYCNGVELECMNCLIHGICMQNLNGGMEIYSDKYCESPVTYGKSGLIFINGRVESLQKKTDVVLFADYIDFLAYKSLHSVLFHQIPKRSDILVLNEVKNLNAMMERLGEYEHLHLFLPLSLAGRTLSKTIEGLYGSSATNHSKIYSCFQRLSDFIRHKDTLLNSSKIKL